MDHITWPENVHCIKKKWLMPRKVICFKPFTLRLDYGETIYLSHKSVEKIVWCYHLNETSLSELSQSPRGATQQSFAW